MTTAGCSIGNKAVDLFGFGSVKQNPVFWSQLDQTHFTVSEFLGEEKDRLGDKGLLLTLGGYI